MIWLYKAIMSEKATPCKVTPVILHGAVFVQGLGRGTCDMVLKTHFIKPCVPSGPEISPSRPEG